MYAHGVTLASVLRQGETLPVPGEEGREECAGLARASLPSTLPLTSPWGGSKPKLEPYGSEYLQLVLLWSPCWTKNIQPRLPLPPPLPLNM